MSTYNIDLPSSEVYKILNEKNVRYLHHANTVATSKSFIKKEALLSRQKDEDFGLEQTPQDSDKKDQKYGIYDYIFLDGLDLADYFDRPNVYGPVLFKFPIDILLRSDILTVRVTKKNPHYWQDSTPDDEKYYISTDELNRRYQAGDKYLDGNSSFMITTKSGILPFSDGLSEILIDDPGRKKEDIEDMQLIKDYLFDDLTQFKSKFPGIKVKKSPRNQSYLANISPKDYLKKYKRTFIKLEA